MNVSGFIDLLSILDRSPFARVSPLSSLPSSLRAKPGRGIQRNRASILSLSPAGFNPLNFKASGYASLSRR
jgi:hypothetical protein